MNNNYLDTRSALEMRVGLIQTENATINPKSLTWLMRGDVIPRGFEGLDHPSLHVQTNPLGRRVTNG